MWAGTIRFSERPAVDRQRLLIEEYEYVTAKYTLGQGRNSQPPGRLIYAGMFALDGGLISEQLAGCPYHPHLHI